MPEILETGGSQGATPATTQSERPTNEDSVTILTTAGPLATKRLFWKAGPTAQDESAGEWSIFPYDNMRTFRISERIVRDIDELAALLSEIELDSRSLIVRGKPAEGIDRDHAYRRLHPKKIADGTIEPATLRPAPRHWVALDIDSIPCPDGLDPLSQPDQTVEYVVGLLPKEFHGVTCWWAFTSGQQIKPGIRLRLVFWSDRRLEDWELKTWLGERVPQDGIAQSKWVQRYPVDLAIFAPAQPIYVARPIVVGSSTQYLAAAASGVGIATPSHHLKSLQKSQQPLRRHGRKPASVRC